MRLAELLSEEVKSDYIQVDGFLDNRSLSKGAQRKLDIGQIGLNFFCKTCNNIRTYTSQNSLFCTGVDDKHISLDCVLECPICHTTLPMWFLIESKENISAFSPYIRILKKERKLSSNIISNNTYGVFSELIDKAEASYINGMGAGAIIYLRIVLEQVVKNVAEKSDIQPTRNFKQLLTEVDKKCHIVPIEFSENSYQLFMDLSECIHGRCEESVSLEKYIPLKRLVKGIIDNIKNNAEITSAIEELNWNIGGNNE